MNIFAKQKWTHRCRKQVCGYQRGMGGIKYELGVNRYTLVSIKKTARSTGNYIQYLIITYNG